MICSQGDAHVPVVICDDPDAVWSAASGQFGFYPRLPFYSKMWQDAGFPEAADGEFSRSMCEALIIQGKENEVADRIRSLPNYGVDEMLASVVVLNDNGKTAQATIELESNPPERKAPRGTSDTICLSTA